MEKGLSQAVAEAKLKEFDQNRIITNKQSTWHTILLSQFPTFINGILLAAAVFSIIVDDIFDGIFIIAIILLNGLFGFIQEFRAEKALEKLQSLTTSTVRVFRDGKEVQIDSQLLVPEDVVVLEEGERIPADGILLDRSHLEVDEAVLTGESLPVSKEAKEAVFLGTLITKGKGHMQVTTTGMATEFGKIAQTLSDITQDRTPLQNQLSQLGKLLSLVAIGLSFLLIPLGIAQGQSLLPLILLAISIGVAAIPEGLPAVITIALAVGTNRMAKKKAIVRKMPAVETLGAVQVLLVDKTGTLTKNAMRVKDYWLLDRKHLPALLKACVLGNTASLIQKAGNDESTIVGDRTDGALLLFAKKEDPVISEILSEGNVIDEYVFDSKVKTITTTWRKGDQTHVFVRGAPESIIANSRLTEKDKTTLEAQFETYAKEGLRVIAFGTKTVNGTVKLTREKAEEELQFLGIIGISDPPRVEVKDAIQKATTAGIRTIMVTGDNELTASDIAKEIGLMQSNDGVITGDALTKMSDEELGQAILTTSVFARAKPHDKLRLTQILRKLGFVVGVTGDGVNDALALKQADVGIAMGETGTDVAKEASDIILADDNFATLIAAVEEGRVIYNNIVKAVTYLLTSNLSELSLIFLAMLLGLPTPLLPTQILWINVVTDGLPALALAVDNKSKSELKEPPRNPKLPILPMHRMLFILAVGAGITIALVSIYWYMLSIGSEAQARLIVFNALIFSHLALAVFMRGQAGYKINKLLFLAIVITVFLQYLITTNAHLQSLFHFGAP